MISRSTLKEALGIEWNARTGEQDLAEDKAAEALDSMDVKDALREGEDAYGIAFAFGALRVIVNLHLRGL